MARLRRIDSVWAEIKILLAKDIAPLKVSQITVSSAINEGTKTLKLKNKPLILQTCQKHYCHLMRIMQKELLQINPQHTIPCLTDGNFALSDSHAIITYLMNKYGKNNSSLYPTDPEKRARIDSKLHFDSGILYPALRENDVPIFFGTATSLEAEGVAKIKSAYDFTEKYLTGVQWLAGNELTLADMSCVASVSTLNELLPIDEKVYPNIIAWIKRCSEFDFYKKGNQPGLLEFRRLLKEYLAR